MICEVEIFAVWTQWLRERALLGTDVLYVNLDETSVERLSPHRRGHVVSLDARGAAASLVHERITRQETHGHLTLVALMCSDPAVQPLLPQILLTKDDRLNRAERNALRALPEPLLWYEGTDGWVTAGNFPALLTLIRRRVLRARPGCQLVLLLDCAAQHMAANVIAHARRLRIILVFVPARLTWLLQPLDSHVFARFKARLHSLQLQARAARETGVLHPGEWVWLLAAAVVEILVRHDWSSALVANGVTGMPHAFRERITDLLGHACHVPLRAPEASELLLLIGRPRPTLPAQLLHWPMMLARHGGLAAIPRAVPLPPAAASSSASSAAPSAPDLPGPIASRTRSRSLASLGV